ncbi:acyltransferase domain-containing protein [Tahibacter amnicola]|uniref:Acyltransferase domain-containing protein n=1 Tax=Tahibacter amnicola TaxID=2976241 RepID=A0ABY6BM05_9GAMM|nr:acyltransferase domain-containing protein [Tahibacter amnicola]UXI70522.1 acyltransferase domain-containing protein [Tahibacter amnicola]
MSAPKTVFLFSGQGSQYYQMGRALFDVPGVFREQMLALDLIAQKRCGRSVIDAIYSAGKGEPFDRTLLTHPAIFMVEYAMAQHLIHAGVVPDMNLGASLGSFAAATVAGCMDVEEALITVIEQAKALEASCTGGGMIAVLANPALFEEPFLSAHSEIAGITFHSHFAVSAETAHLNAIERGLHDRGVAFQRLAVSFAFHSRWIDPAQERFNIHLKTLGLSRGQLPLVCCDQTTTISTLPEDYFWRVIRRPMQFRDTIAALEQQGTYRYIDVGPSGTMATFIKYAVARTSTSSTHATLSPFGNDQKNLAALTNSR